MKVAVAAVTSVDGKLTRHHEKNIYEWVSKDDQGEFYSLIAQYQALVFGSGTYEVIKKSLQLSAKRLRIVLTSRPEEFKKEAVEGQLEFKDMPVSELVSHLEDRGIESLLVLGGPRMIGEFLEKNLVEDFFLTIEPRLFGTGSSLLNIPCDIPMQLVESKQLNSTGTMFLRYKIK